MEDDNRWDELFVITPQEFWDRMADDTRAQYDAGLTTDLVDADFDDPPTLSRMCGWCGVELATSPTGECDDCATLPGHDYDHVSIVPRHPALIDAAQLAAWRQERG